MKVGTIVKLRVDCLGNEKGTLGVVFYDYGGGSQAIFKNGNYDGFSETRKMPNGQVEAEFFLEKTGFCDSLAGYQFKNVIAVEQDFRKGIFSEIWR